MKLFGTQQNFGDHNKYLGVMSQNAPAAVGPNIVKQI